ncbi:MAG: hypothetical protein R2681_09170 [Pyrinomonadaceae bacterium]
MFPKFNVEIWAPNRASFIRVGLRIERNVPENPRPTVWRVRLVDSG